MTDLGRGDGQTHLPQEDDFAAGYETGFRAASAALENAICEQSIEFPEAFYNWTEGGGYDWQPIFDLTFQWVDSHELSRISETSQRCQCSACQRVAERYGPDGPR